MGTDIREELGRAIRRFDDRGIREQIHEVVRAFEENDLLIEAGALAFRILLASIPAMLFLIGLIGFFDLASVWTDHVAPTLRDSVSAPAYKLIDQAVRYVLDNQQGFWVTAGAAIAVWELSGVVRGAANVLNRLYGVEDGRSRGERLLNSLWVGAALGALLFGAVAAAKLVPLGLRSLLGDGELASAFGLLLGILLAASLLLTAIALIVRVGPDVKRPLGWVTFGAALVVLAWIVMTALFAFYLSTIASYSTVFGNMATVFILLEYVFLLAIVFLGGLVIDALAEGRAET